MDIQCLKQHVRHSLREKYSMKERYKEYTAQKK